VVLSGTIRVLVEQGDLAADAPGLARFAALIAAREHAESIAPTVGEHLDEIGWPIMNDARLALRAIDRLTDMPMSMLALVQNIRAGEVVTSAARATFAMFVATPGMSDEDALALVERLHGKPAADACRGFARELERTVGDRPRRMYEACWNLAVAVREGRAGWLAYHAYRRLPSPAAVAAAAVVRAVGELTGHSIASETVEWACALAAAS
jgi:hypothetical protein